ncbi:beta-galactosidase [Aestuariicella hydrocarbonica]|uniref:Beta-galactosidase n=2 Tax=Pseudomaricurvus hydrocarbonicus TaxID=1470433 RepID=A0A9E5MN58_9GAMM|nr:beta-galactosidase [Aestuariicella hydrocarbonica]
MEELLYGVAYYDEYMPVERLQTDSRMMKEAGINVVRIAESTWGTLEPSDGKFDFSHVDRVLEVMHKVGIKVIVGTPTYAIPTWMARQYPDILAVTPSGQRSYGARQNMDITHPDFRRHAERVIRQLIGHVKDHPAVIGFQVDNETKHYGTSGANVQKAFVTHMRGKYPSLEVMNHELGLDYWSNRINSWEDFPSVNGSINASLNGEFSRFQRGLVTEYLAWQAGLVNEYKRPDQFVMQNFDFEWRGYSYGIQPDVDHFAAARAMDIAGVDIYHPGQDDLTGTEISFGGDMARSMKDGQNYLVVETEAQGFPQWTPYPGQLRLQAFSHVASGANMVAYWPWHSIHNAIETYWKGLLSHDFKPNPTYNEAKTIGADFKRIGDKLVNLKKNHQVAILFSNDALTGFNSFSFGWDATENYNDILRPFYDALYRLNVGVDFVDPSSKNIEQYKLLVVPVLYAASDELLQRLNDYVAKGGRIVYTFKSGFANENDKVRVVQQPGLINQVVGVQYSQFVLPNKVSLAGDPYQVGDDNNSVSHWMELLTPTTAEVLARYEHPVWGQYAAITRNQFGRGSATYIGFMPGTELIEKIMLQALEEAKLMGPDQQLHFPLIVKSGVNQRGRIVHYYFNYSADAHTFSYPHAGGVELLSARPIKSGSTVTLTGWDFKIIEEATVKQ